MPPMTEDGSAPGGINPWLVAVTVMLATFMEVLDTSIAAVALPYIAGSLSATNHEATWVLTSYLVAHAHVLPASSWFAVPFGRKRFLIVCIAIFTISPSMQVIAQTLFPKVRSSELQSELEALQYRAEGK
jgi:MFS transporter, DHA2 family, multidrug resistance protein